MKRVLKVIAIVAGGLVLAAAAFVGVEVLLFERSVGRQYDVPLPTVTRSADAAVLERGRHLAVSIGGCATAECHGADLSGNKDTDLGPLGNIVAPNVTSAGRAAAYTDAELVRLVQHGLKRDGRSVLFMPAHDIAWIPEDDLVAIVSWMRSMPAVQKADLEMHVGVLGKVLDRFDLIAIDTARRIDHEKLPESPRPEPTARYGAFLARSCTGCHGDRLSGGPIPGAPSWMPVPRNLTPHATGLVAWTFADFERALDTGTRPDGAKLNPLMPFEALSKMDATERQALWAYLRSLEPRPSGDR